MSFTFSTTLSPGPRALKEARLGARHYGRTAFMQSSGTHTTPGKHTREYKYKAARLNLSKPTYSLEELSTTRQKKWCASFVPMSIASKEKEEENNTKVFRWAQVHTIVRICKLAAARPQTVGALPKHTSHREENEVAGCLQTLPYTK